MTEPITLADLPNVDTQRWVPRRKAAVIVAVDCGLLTMEEACERYSISTEEFLSWRQAINDHGVKGLRVTRLQDYRSNYEE